MRWVWGVGLLLVGGIAASLFTHAPGPRQAPAPSASERPADTAPTPRVPERLRVLVHKRHPHDPRAFTQGLAYDDGRLFESTGLRGRSTLREVEIATGIARRHLKNEPALFAEGLAIVDKKLIQLTWHARRALVFGRDDFAAITEHRYDGEGWGLCYDDTRLVMSNGSDTLTFREPETFAETGSVRVTRAGRPVAMLNELECVRGKVYANIWQSDEIVRIEPSTGTVEAVIDASGLLEPSEARAADVLNGIAFMPERGRFLITGKLWPALFEVSFEPERDQR